MPPRPANLHHERQTHLAAPGAGGLSALAASTALSRGPRSPLPPSLSCPEEASPLLSPASCALCQLPKPRDASALTCLRSLGAASLWWLCSPSGSSLETGTSAGCCCLEVPASAGPAPELAALRDASAAWTAPPEGAASRSAELAVPARPAAAASLGKEWSASSPPAAAGPLADPALPACGAAASFPAAAGSEAPEAPAARGACCLWSCPCCCSWWHFPASSGS